MKYLLLFLLSVIILFPARAQDYTDSLYHDYARSYLREKDSGAYFTDAFVIAGRQTFALENKTMQLALKQLDKKDTAGIDVLTQKIIDRFINEQFLEIECKKDYSQLADLFNQYTASQCYCVTEKMNTLPPLHRTGQLPGIMKECTKTIMEDNALADKWGQTVDAIGKEKFTDLIHYIVPYMYAHCPYLRSGIIEKSLSEALNNYHHYYDSVNDVLVQSISENILQENQIDQLKEYFSKTTLFSKTKEYFEKVAVRVDTLKPMPDEINWIDANMGSVDTLTCIYTGLKPEIVCQIVIKKNWQNLRPAIKSIQFVQVKGIKNKQEYFDLFYDNSLYKDDLLQEQ